MTTVIQSLPARRRPWLLINRNYSLLFTGQTISLLGDQISTYTLIMWIVSVIAAGQALAPLAVSAILITSIVPALLIGPLAGVFVDRWDYRLTMIRADTLRAVLWFALIAFSGVIPLPFIPASSLALVRFIALCTVNFLSSMCAQFFGPANMALLGEIVPEERRPQATGWNQTMRAFAVIVGPLLAAPLFFLFGIQWALFIDALSFVVSLVTIWAISAPARVNGRKARSNVRTEFNEGLRFSLGNSTVRTIIIASCIATFGAGAFDALFVFFLLENLHTSTSMTGTVAAMLGVGTIAGALVFGKIALRIGLKRLTYLSLFITGLGMIVLSRMTLLIPALILFFLLGVFQASLRIACTPLILKETPRAMIGRVSAVLSSTSLVASLISATIAGYLAGILFIKLHIQLPGIVLGPVDTTFSIVGLLFICSAAYVFYALTDRSTPQLESAPEGSD